MFLAQAREKREKARALIAEGTNPAAQKKFDQLAAELSARSTFKLVAEEFLEQARERDLAEATMRKKEW